MRKICVVIGSRANYSSIKSAMQAIQAHPDLELQVVVGASAVLDRYGSVVNLIEKDGFKPAAKVYMLIEGENPATMAKSTGLGLLELPTIFDQLQPDVVLTVGDRFETMATTLAAAYMNIPLAHTMGGEVTGTIDESIRHAVTKFAHIHFPACSEAKERIIKLGERPEDVYLVGCPRIDLVAEVLAKHKNGVGQTSSRKASVAHSIWMNRSSSCRSILSPPSMAKANARSPKHSWRSISLVSPPSPSGRTRMPVQRIFRGGCGSSGSISTTPISVSSKTCPPMSTSPSCAAPPVSSATRAAPFGKAHSSARRRSMSGRARPCVSADTM